MKKKLIIITVIIILLSFAIFILVNHKNDNKVNNLNNNSNVIKDQMLDNLSITKVSVAIDENKTSTFSANVTNTSDEENQIETIDIIIKDKDGKVLTTLLGYVGKGTKKGDIIKISASTDIDLTEAYSVEYKKSSE